MVGRLAGGLVAEFGWLAANSLVGGLGSTGPWLGSLWGSWCGWFAEVWLGKAGVAGGRFSVQTRKYPD